MLKKHQLLHHQLGQSIQSYYTLLQFFTYHFTANFDYLEMHILPSNRYGYPGETVIFRRVRTYDAELTWNYFCLRCAPST